MEGGNYEPFYWRCHILRMLLNLGNWFEIVVGLFRVTYGDGMGLKFLSG